MTTDKVRIINVETAKVKWVSPLVASDIKQLFAYGFIVQNLPKKEEPEKIKESVKEKAMETIINLAKEAEAEKEPLDLLNISEPVVTIEENTAKGKPGRKPNPKQ